LKREKKPKRTEDSVQAQSSEFDVEQVPSNVLDDSIHSNYGEQLMNTNFDFASLQTIETEQVAADFSEYQKLLREIASGKCRRSKPEILAVLKAVDRDSRMLEEDVRKRTERDAKITEVDRTEEYESATKTLTEEQKVLDNEFHKIEEQYREKDWAIQSQINAFTRKLRTISSYRRELLEGCENLELILKHNELERQLNDPEESYLYTMQRQLGDEIGEAEYALMNLPITRDYAEQKQKLKAKLKELRAKYEEGELKKLDFQKQEDKQKAAIQEIEERMIRS